MTEEEFEKKVKWTQIFCYALIIIYVLIAIVSFIDFNIVHIITVMILITTMALFAILTKKRKIAGPIIGIVLGVLYIIQLDIFSIIIGIFILVDCIQMLSYINKTKNINKRNQTKNERFKRIN